MTAVPGDRRLADGEGSCQGDCQTRRTGGRIAHLRHADRRKLIVGGVFFLLLLLFFLFSGRENKKVSGKTFFFLFFFFCVLILWQRLFRPLLSFHGHNPARAYFLIGHVKQRTHKMVLKEINVMLSLSSVSLRLFFI